MMKHWKLGLLLAVIGLMAGPVSDAGAQTRVARRAPVPDAPRGWIGVSFDVLRNRQGAPVEIVVTDVSDGSPAAEAGLKRGDRLLSINELDTPRHLAELSERLHLKPGDRVVIEAQRDDRHRRFRMRAAELPTGYAIGSRLEIALQSDSMVDSWVRAMDSLRIELVAEGQRDPWGGSRERTRGRIAVVADGGPVVAGSGSGRAPSGYEFFIFRGEVHDSLRQEMAELNRNMAELETRIEARERELRRLVGRDQRSAAEDRELGRLQSSLEAATRRSAQLQAALTDASRNTAGFEDLLDRTPGVWSTVEREGVAPTAEYRPLTPYLLGRNRVAGAEVVDLKPELAEYFQVEGGVLVVDVAPRTPAALAGIVPGDVITRIDQVGVRTVEDLRFGVSMAGETLPISLVRQGASIQVLLRR